MNKYKKLLLSILLDLIGLATYAFPVLGESFDFIWAPLSTLIMMKLYGGIKGKIAGGISFIEEIIPGTDFIPTFTLTWIYSQLTYPKEKIVKAE